MHYDPQVKTVFEEETAGASQDPNARPAAYRDGAPSEVYDHRKAWEAFDELLAFGPYDGVSLAGRTLLMLGASGSGKTHLLESFRRHLHYRELGVMAVLRLSACVDATGRFLLEDAVGSLAQPYRESMSADSALQRISSALVRDPALMDPELVARFRDERDEDDSRRLANKISTRLYLESGRFQEIDPDLIKALLYLQKDEPLIHRLVSRFLRCEVLGNLDRRALGDIVPRTEDRDPKAMLEQLGRLVDILFHVPLVLGVDQDGDLPLDSLRRGLRWVAEYLERVPESLAVLACRDETWRIHAPFLPRPLARQIESDPAPVIIRVRRRDEPVLDLVRDRMARLQSAMTSPATISEAVEPALTSELKGGLIRGSAAQGLGAVAELPLLEAAEEGGAGPDLEEWIGPADGATDLADCEVESDAEHAADAVAPLDGEIEARSFPWIELTACEPADDAQEPASAEPSARFDVDAVEDPQSDLAHSETASVEAASAGILDHATRVAEVPAEPAAQLPAPCETTGMEAPAVAAVEAAAADPAETSGGGDESLRPAAVARIGEQWASYRKRRRARGKAPLRGRVDLVAWALQAAAGELPRPTRVEARAEGDEIELALERGEEVRRIRVCLCDEELKNGVLARRIQRIQGSMNGHEVVLLRNEAFPAGRNSAARLLDAGRSSGWRTAVITEDELLALRSARGFVESIADDPALRRWMAADRPITQVEVIRAILGMAEEAPAEEAAAPEMVAEPMAQPVEAAAAPSEPVPAEVEEGEPMVRSTPIGRALCGALGRDAARTSGEAPAADGAAAPKATKPARKRNAPSGQRRGAPDRAGTTRKPNSKKSRSPALKAATV